MRRGEGACLVCGAELTYYQEAKEMTCVFCGKKEMSHASCKEGHYVCDSCHAEKGIEAIMRECGVTASKNPIEIMQKIMEDPYIYMHGPEHHVMVGAALLTAYRNAGGALDLEQALELVREGADLAGLELEAPLELEAYPDRGGVLLFVRSLAPRRVWHPFLELEALLDTARSLGYERVVCAFQPHTYTRTKALFDDFVKELLVPDVVVLAEIFAAREQNTIGISSMDLCRKIPGSVYCPTLDKVTAALARIACPGDLILTVGAGDIYKAGEKLLKEKEEA